MPHLEHVLAPADDALPDRLAVEDVAVDLLPVDATAEQTDADSFAPLEPVSDGFRNYRAAGLAADRFGPFSAAPTSTCLLMTFSFTIARRAAAGPHQSR